MLKRGKPDLDFAEKYSIFEKQGRKPHTAYGFLPFYFLCRGKTTKHLVKTTKDLVLSTSRLVEISRHFVKKGRRALGKFRHKTAL